MADTPENPGQNSNQRVKNAETQIVIKFMQEHFDELKADNKKDHERIELALKENCEQTEARLGRLEISESRCDDRWEGHQQDHRDANLVNRGLEIFFASLAALIGVKVK